MESSMMGEYLLRGTARILHDEKIPQDGTGGDDAHEHPDSGSDEDTSFLLFAAVIVGFISLAYLICVFQMFRVWFYRVCFGRDVSLGDRAIFVDEGRVHELNSKQRRAVLEAIFSETSKAVTEDDVYQRTQKRKEKRELRKKLHGTFDSAEDDDEIPSDVEIPTIHTSSSKGSEDSETTSDVDQSSESSPHPVTPTSLSSSASQVRSLSFDEASRTLKASLAPEILLTRSSSSLDRNTISDSPEAEHLTPKLSHSSADRASIFRNDSPLDIIPVVSHDADSVDQVLKSVGSSSSSSSTSQDGHISYPAPLFAPNFISSGRSDNLALPEFNMKPRARLSLEKRTEETKEEIEEIESYQQSALSLEKRTEETKEEIENYQQSQAASHPGPFTLMRVDSHSHSATTTSDYTYDDETEDSMCAICLSGYKEGDMLITSKYCSHLFHKDCILEWLDKNDKCPCCRVDMVTEGEINKAATYLVGKTRMYLAVASSYPVHRTISAAQRGSPSTPRASPHSSNYRGQVTPPARGGMGSTGGQVTPPARGRLGSTGGQVTPPARRRMGSVGR